MYFIRTVDFTARKIIGVHLVVMILLFAGEVVLLRTALNASNEYSAIVGLMEPDEVSTLPYATYEGYLSKEFNRFFFGAISDCQSKPTHVSHRPSSSRL